MKSQYFRFAVLLVSALALGGCTALQQFPEVSDNYITELGTDDPDYAEALAKIYPDDSSAVDAEVKKRVRNALIETRMAVIDTNFQEFQIALAQENVQVDFLVSVAEVAVGGAGALVSETASRILSAVSGGLAGGQAAYSKAALYEKALSALLAQMIASRKAILVRINERRNMSYAEYWLSDAKNDLDAYLFAGSLPGAIVATSADAQVKNDEAEDKLAELRESPFFDDRLATRIINWLWPNGTDGAVNTPNRDALRAWIDKDKGITDLPIQKFLDSKQLKEARERAITYLQIP